MINAISAVPHPVNEPVKTYAPGTRERAEIQKALGELGGTPTEIPLWIGGEARRTPRTRTVTAPHAHQHGLGTVFEGGETETLAAIEAANAARHDWARMPFDERAAILLRAADLLAGRLRARVNAATMLGQSKTVHQAEIDSACELIDFFRFNVHFARTLLEQQPLSAPGMWNRTDYRPLDGFVLAVTPFNFTAIAGNLPTAPALMGNTVVWKPASTAALSAHMLVELLEAAGMPPGVINVVYGPGAPIGNVALQHATLGGVHFTGSTATFQHMWRTVGENIGSYRCYPRLVGETGGKDFIVAHPSADPTALAVALVRGAFEYQGQKCSAVSRAYIPDSLWDDVMDRVAGHLGELKMGDPADLSHFMGAVIDRPSFDKIGGYIDHAREASDSEVVLGGGRDDSVGYFIEPTVVVTTNPNHKLMEEEIFGPVLTLYRFPDSAFDETLTLCDEATPYALTGAIFARDRAVVQKAMEALRFSAGNFYINDKPTGAVVGQQPFGGSRASGTNDKAGSALNLLRWTSPRSIKETLDPPRAVPYPFMEVD